MRRHLPATLGGIATPLWRHLPARARITASLGLWICTWLGLWHLSLWAVSVGWIAGTHLCSHRYRFCWGSPVAHGPEPSDRKKGQGTGDEKSAGMGGSSSTPALPAEQGDQQCVQLHDNSDARHDGDRAGRKTLGLGKFFGVGAGEQNQKDHNQAGATGNQAGKADFDRLRSPLGSGHEPAQDAVHGISRDTQAHQKQGIENDLQTYLAVLFIGTLVFASVPYDIEITEYQYGRGCCV